MESATLNGKDDDEWEFESPADTPKEVAQSRVASSQGNKLSEHLKRQNTNIANVIFRYLTL